MPIITNIIIDIFNIFSNHDILLSSSGASFQQHFLQKVQIRDSHSRPSVVISPLNLLMYQATVIDFSHFCLIQ